MNWRNTEIDAIKDFGFCQAVHLKDFSITIKPGQILYIFQPDSDDHIIPLTYVKHENNQSWFTSATSIQWQIGKNILVRGPIGNGFHPIGRYGKILFIVPGGLIGSLQPLIDIAIQTQKSVAISSKNNNWQIHPEVEIISIEDIDFAISWADFIYLECARNELENFPDIINKIKHHRTTSEIFIYSPVLCGGNGDCMVCTVHTKSGFRRICKDGPILPIEELEIN